MCLLLKGKFAMLLAVLSIAVHAQDFPSKPVRIIVPTSVAIRSDLAARFIAEQMPVRRSEPMSSSDGPRWPISVARRSIDMRTHHKESS